MSQNHSQRCKRATSNWLKEFNLSDQQNDLHTDSKHNIGKKP